MTSMKQGITEFIAEKRALEDRLHALIAVELEGFKLLTGASVAGVSTSITSLHYLGKPTEYLVSSVRVDVPLD